MVYVTADFARMFKELVCSKCSGDTAKHARPWPTAENVKDPVLTGNGFYRIIDVMGKKCAILVSVNQQGLCNVLIAFFGTPPFSNFTDAEVEVYVMDDLELTKTVVNTSEGAYKVYSAALYDGFNASGMQKFMEAMKNAEIVRDFTLATKNLPVFFSTHFDYRIRHEAMEMAVKAKFASNGGLYGQNLLKFIEDCFQFQGKPILPNVDIAKATFHFAELSDACNVWAYKAKDFDVFFQMFEEAKFDVTACRQALVPLGQNLLGDVLDKVFRQLRTIPNFAEVNQRAMTFKVYGNRDCLKYKLLDLGTFYDSAMYIDSKDLERFNKEMEMFKTFNSIYTDMKTRVDAAELFVIDQREINKKFKKLGLGKRQLDAYDIALIPMVSKKAKESPF